MASNFDDFKLAVEALSGGKNTVILDDVGMPSVMVQIPKYKMSQLISGGSENVHPAFMVDGAEKDVMYVGKFHDIVVNDRTYSLPIKDPAAWVTFDQGVTYNRNKGKGWSLMPYALWCAIALRCRKNNCMPHGNNNYGSDVDYPTEVGIESLADSGKTAHVYEGSGPASWYHDGTRAGIYGMNGNVWDRVAGMRLYNGEIQVIPYSNCFLSDASMAEGSSLWKAIDVSGNLVAPGSANTLKWGNSNTLTAGSVTATDSDSGFGGSFTDMALDSSITTVPEIAKALLLYPDEPKGDYGGDSHWWSTSGERIPCCGGTWYNTSDAGVFCVYAFNVRANSDRHIGLRSAYCKL
jgi:hypothetical protein